MLPIGASGKDHKQAYFSNYCSDVVEAPGVDILSTLPGKGTDVSRYGIMSGTSQAEAFASGTAAVLWSTLPRENSAEVRTSVIAGLKDHGTDYSFVLSAYKALYNLNTGTQPDEYYIEFVNPNPEKEARVSGEIDLSVQVKNPFKIYQIKYELYRKDETLIALLGTVHSANIPDSGLVSLKWDTSKVTIKEGETETTVDLDDGKYYVKATSYGIDGENISKLDDAWVSLTIVNNQQNGLSIEIKKPDGTKASEAIIKILHAYSQTDEYGEEMSYEKVWSGISNKEGFISIPGTIANDGNEYIVIAYGTEPAFFYHKTVKSPAKIVMDANDGEKISISAEKLNNEPLAGAQLVMEMLEASIPGCSNSDGIVDLDSNFEDNKFQFPVFKLNAEGKAEFTISKGVYNFYMISPEDKYYLYMKNYQINDTTASIDFHRRAWSI